MKNIYKGFISILAISILAVGTVSAVNGPYTGCISTQPGKFDDPKGIFYYFQSGSSPISSCKAGDTQITVYEKNFIDNSISNLQTQINNLVSGLNSLTNRISNLENDPYPKLYSMKYNLTRFNVSEGDSPLANLTFTLPKDAIVQVQTDGMFINWLGYAGIGFDDFSVDGQNCIDWCQMVWYGDGKYDGSGEWVGFEQSKVGYFKAGTHTIKVHGVAFGSASYQTDNSVEVWTRISATAYDTNKADIQALNINKVSNSQQIQQIEPPKPKK